MVLATVAALLGLAACSEGAGAAKRGRDERPNVVVTKDGLEIALVVAEVVPRVDGYVAEPLTKLFHARVEVTNGTSSAVGVAPQQFRVRDSGGAERFADPAVLASGLVEGACFADHLVAPDGQAACTVAFELPFGATPTELVYQRESGDFVSIALSLGFVCSECGELCADTRVDPLHCGACSTPVPLGGACSDGVPGCAEDMCSGECVSLASDPGNCGACGNACGSNSICGGGGCGCADGFTQCEACVDTASDPYHCGSCNHSCKAAASWAECSAGKCRVDGIAVEAKTSCAAVCSSIGMDCVSAEAIYEDKVDDGSTYDCYGNQHVASLACSATPAEEYVGEPAYACVYDFYFLGCDCAE